VREERLSVTKEAILPLSWQGARQTVPKPSLKKIFAGVSLTHIDSMPK
jgi:hypothetical protein